jgi:glycosyltransferase involved in cell wall biosynthesis
MKRLRVLHAIHDFLPRYRAGSEIYALALGRALARRHHVTILCADYDPARSHGEVVWRLQDGLPVVELINNWICASFEDTYRPPVIGDRLRHVLRAVQPDVLHVHNLLNLSFDLPLLARAAGIPVVATLHDYTLVCASGGQRIHRADRHVCHQIDLDRCARCFGESPFGARMSLGLIAAAPAPIRALA